MLTKRNHPILNLILSLLFSMVVLPTVAVAESGAEQDSQLPQAVGEAASSVFRIVPLNLGNSGEATDAAGRAKYTSEHCASPRHFITKLRCEYIANTCPSQGECFIPFTTSGTGFLVGDGRSLVSAFHVLGASELLSLTFLAPALRQYPEGQKLNVYRKYEPAFLLYNSNSELVYDSREFVDTHRFEMVGDPLRGLNPEVENAVPSRLQGFAYDFAEVRLQKTLGKGLKTAIAQESDQVFWALGYPMRTEGRMSNYDGFNIYANPGYRTSLIQTAKDFGFADNKANREFPLLVSRNDIVEGFSGGPLFNKKGEVIGIISATLNSETEFRGASFAVPWQDFGGYRLNGSESASR